MAEAGLEPEVQEIFAHIRHEHNFLLSGGAGSGKTYSLVQFIQEAIRLNPTVTVACMTYTNAAVKEIEERVNHENLQVSTIHDFLWDNIKSFQNELKKSLIQLINDPEVKIKSPDGIVDATYYDALVDGIQYKEYVSIKNGIISHDEVLILANYMFQSYPKLCAIMKDKYKFILVDEYQDTNPVVVEIFLQHLKQSSRKNIIGFFGDSMQSIYDDGIGGLDEYIQTGDVYEVKKEQNRRNPHLVIELANRLRTDEIVQHPSTDNHAPNMQDERVKEGSIKFYYSAQGVDDLETLKRTLDWDFDNAIQTKELNLTHNLIAPKAGFGELMEIYDDDKILDYKNRITKYIKENNVATDFSEKLLAKLLRY
ncbi:UvrD-helicase domain-containing protein [Malaciobacter marinus]|uniref:UvrD-helicase domain-containing protein n=1 Tax=Malaciobacter marinus TaxID=505249 RepID=UPI003B00029B